MRQSFTYKCFFYFFFQFEVESRWDDRSLTTPDMPSTTRAPKRPPSTRSSERIRKNARLAHSTINEVVLFFKLF